MKHVTRILVVVALFSLVFGSALIAEEKAGKKCETMKCCVCKKGEVKKDSSFKVEYKGKTMYFCSENCMKAFKKSPEKFLKECCPGKTVYVCPMKQCNVKQDKPGKCPKCGMKLKKKVAHSECCTKESTHTHNHKDHTHKHDHQH